MDKESSQPGLNGAKKAALLLMSLGKEEAAKVLSHLDDKMIELVVTEMSKIRYVSKIEKEKILDEFSSTLSDLKDETGGGIDTAKELLSRSLGKSKADEILKKIDAKQSNQDFEFLNDIDSRVLASLIQTESPQIIAVTLAYIAPKKAAETLKQLPKEIQSKVAMKLAITSRTHPEAVAEIARVLKKKYQERDRMELTEAGGTEVLANILNHLDKSFEDGILKDLSTESPEIAEQVKDKLYSFEDILNLDSKEMRLLVNRLGGTGNTTMAVALKGAGEEIKRHFFSCISQNRASDILEEMDSIGKVILREITSARNTILKNARDLEEEGLVVLKKRKEEYI